MYSPLVSAVTVRVSPVPSLTIVTLALPTTAPDASVTVPRIVPLTDCARRLDEPRSRDRQRDEETQNASGELTCALVHKFLQLTKWPLTSLDAGPGNG